MIIKGGFEARANFRKYRYIYLMGFCEIEVKIFLTLKTIKVPTWVNPNPVAQVPTWVNPNNNYNNNNYNNNNNNYQAPAQNYQGIL